MNAPRPKPTCPIHGRPLTLIGVWNDEESWECGQPCSVCVWRPFDILEGPAIDPTPNETNSHDQGSNH